MTMTKPRYYLPKKAIKADCPNCGPRHRNTLSCFVDRLTGNVLPEPFGRCDRESNCGYFFSPYHKGTSGLSYADEQKGPPIPREWFQLAGICKRQQITRQNTIIALGRKGATTDQAERVAAFVFDQPDIGHPVQPLPVYSIPNEVMSKSLNHYERNEFARFLSGRFGYAAATNLLERFQIGTSARWSGACVFWLVDEYGRVRGGQIALYDQTGHKVKNIDREGKTRACISSVRAALKWKYRGLKQPDWLDAYAEDAETWPVLFGLPQLKTAPLGTPVAIVEGPKTAIVCSQLLPGFTWLAIGGLSYLTLNTDIGRQRLAPLRGRKIMLYPDLKAFDKWSHRAESLRDEGFDVSVSDVLEKLASYEDREGGLDLADFLLREPNTISSLSELLPGQIVQFNAGQVEHLTVTSDDDYPALWDAPNAYNAQPTIQPQTFYDWCQQNPCWPKADLPADGSVSLNVDALILQPTP